MVGAQKQSQWIEQPFVISSAVGPLDIDQKINVRKRMYQ